MPEWYRKRKIIAKSIYKRNVKAKYGSDINLESYKLDAQPRGQIRSLYDLSPAERKASHNVGTREDETYRGGTYFQYDRDPIYVHYTETLRECLPKGLVISDIMEAIKKYPWLKMYWFRACPLGLDKYTAFVGSHETAGAFVWSQKGTVVPYPIQACLFMGTDDFVQIPHNILIAEPNSSLNIITGCTVHPACVNAAHIACTEIYVKRNAELTWTMIHSWKPGFDVRPRMGAIVEHGGILRLNYVLTSPVKSIQLYPTVILLGEGAKVSFRNLLIGFGKSNVDVGSCVIFNAEKTRGEVVSRAIVKEQASVKMRGKLWGRKPDTKGHLECRALLLSDQARALAYPVLQGEVKNTDLTHEAAIGKIAEEELLYLMSRGLTQDEATSMITRGFLDVEIPGLPEKLIAEIKNLVAITTERIL